MCVCVCVCVCVCAACSAPGRSLCVCVCVWSFLSACVECFSLLVLFHSLIVCFQCDVFTLFYCLKCHV